MIKNNTIFSTNAKHFHHSFFKQKSFLKYPADWVIRFHNVYLRKMLPSGRVLDYGCGSANNSIFFIENGYDVYGVDITDAVFPLIKANLRLRNLDTGLSKRFSIIPPDCVTLPFRNNFFDFILSNQVLYFLPSEKHIKKVCRELSRCLRPGGLVFFTMMGPKNRLIKSCTRRIKKGKVYEVAIDDPRHRLFGLREFIYLVRNTKELKNLFSEFECVNTGYFDQCMFTISRNFHWIFIGKKRT